MTIGNESANQLDFIFHKLGFTFYIYYSTNDCGNINLFGAKAHISSKIIDRADQLDFII